MFSVQIFGACLLLIFAVLLALKVKKEQDKPYLAVGISAARVVFALLCPWNILLILYRVDKNSFAYFAVLEVILIGTLALVFWKVFQEDGKRYTYEDKDKKMV